MREPKSSARAAWRERLYVVIFEADTPAGKAFDVALIGTILLSVATVTLESVRTVDAAYGSWLRSAEWIFTVLFTIEYGLRLICARPLWRYATSFFGIIDLLAILPTYLSVLFPGTQYLLVVRLLQTLRNSTFYLVASPARLLLPRPILPAHAAQ